MLVQIALQFIMHNHRYMMKRTLVCEKSILCIILASNMWNDVHNIEKYSTCSSLIVPYTTEKNCYKKKS